MKNLRPTSINKYQTLGIEGSGKKILDMNILRLVTYIGRYLIFYLKFSFHICKPLFSFHSLVLKISYFAHFYKNVLFWKKYQIGNKKVGRYQLSLPLINFACKNNLSASTPSFLLIVLRFTTWAKWTNINIK